MSFVVAGALTVATPRAALACGLAPHVGATGLILECDGQRHDDVGPWRAAVQGALPGGFRWNATVPTTKGGDGHKYQAGAGVAVDLPRHLDFVVEVMPLGERSLTAGAGWAF